MRAALTAAFAAAALAVPAAVARPAAPAFRVSITATLFRQVVDDIATTPAAGGCRFVQEADAAQTIVMRTSAPVVRTLAQLSSWKPAVVPLTARETRVGRFRKGAEHCSAAAGEPATSDDTSGCGERAYALGQDGVRVGFLGMRDRRFSLRLATTVPDPFAGRCLTRAFDNVVSVPPARWAKRRWWTVAKRAQAAVGKPLVVRWTDTVHVEPLEARTAGAYDRFTSFEHDTVSWEVRLTPVP